MLQSKHLYQSKKNNQISLLFYSSRNLKNLLCSTRDFIKIIIHKRRKLTEKIILNSIKLKEISITKEDKNIIDKINQFQD
jgi:tRNA G18 (ribose-2'-O)-methylase SpoU